MAKKKEKKSTLKEKLFKVVKPVAAWCTVGGVSAAVLVLLIVLISMAA